jgi:hypothetical protein
MHRIDNRYRGQTSAKDASAPSLNLLYRKRRVIRGEVRGKKHIPTSCMKLFFNIISKDFAEIPLSFRMDKHGKGSRMISLCSVSPWIVAVIIIIEYSNSKCEATSDQQLHRR